LPIVARKAMSENCSPSATTSSPLDIQEDDVASLMLENEPLLHQDEASQSLSEPDGTTFAVWGLLSSDH